MNTKVFTKNELSEAAALIRRGGIVAMPTETVYGLAANAFEEKAVKKIFTAKGRESDNPLIVHIANISDWEKLTLQIPDEARRLAERFWPGPLTIVLKKSEAVPDVVSGGLDTVAVRMPKNKIAFRFIKECGCPLAAPSANISGCPSPTKFEHVYNDLNGKIDGIINGGDCSIGVESTVISLADSTPVLLRPGRITAEQIEKVIGKIKIHRAVTEAIGDDESAPSPGMKYKHYSPKASLTLVKGSSEEYVEYVNQNADKDTAVICFEEQANMLSAYNTFLLGNSNDSVSQAKELFGVLRSVDEGGFKKALSPLPEYGGVGLAVANRLLRASGFNIVQAAGEEKQVEKPKEIKAKQKEIIPEPEKAEEKEDVLTGDKIVEEINFTDEIGDELDGVTELLSEEDLLPDGINAQEDGTINTGADEEEFDGSVETDDANEIMAADSNVDEDLPDYLNKIEGIKIIGVTGKTGAGKSIVAKNIARRERRCALINADKLYHTLLKRENMAVGLVFSFGNGILTNKNIDRAKLAKTAFANERNLNKLNNSVLPYVSREVVDLINKAKDSGYESVVLDAPTLIESRLNEICDEVIFVQAEKDVRVKRIKERDGISDYTAALRTKLEKPDSFYKRYADLTVTNN